MADGDIVRKITISATGENIDSTTQSTLALGAATAALTVATVEAKKQSDEINKAYRSQSDALDQNNDSYKISGEQVASLANHLRQASEAAYALSPAFRGIVNESVVPALRAVAVGIGFTTTAIVSGVNATGTALVSAGSAVSEFSPRLGVLSNAMGVTGRAMEGFSVSATGLASTILSRVAPAFRILAAIQFVVDSWKLGTEALERYNEISKNADGLSTDFYQRVVKGAQQSGVSVDALTASLKTLKETMSADLGGSAGGNKLKELTDAGNFAGNTGVSQFKAANNPEQQLRAIAALNRQAADAGERLAAIDLTKTILGKDIADNLKNDSDFLDNILRTADSLSKTSIVSDDQLARATLLQTRYDAALQILSERWKPFKDIMTEIGIRLHETFTQDLTDIAALSTGLTTLYNKASDLLGLAWDKLKNGVQGAVTLVDAAGNPYEANIAPKEQGPLTSETPSAMDVALGKLRSGLLQKTQVKNAGDETNFVHDSVLRDTSKDPNAKLKPEPEDDTSAYDRAQESLLKYIEVTKAAALSVSDNIGVQEKFKAIAQLTAAGIKDGLTPEAAKLKAEMSGLAEKAGDAALALGKARIESQIKFGQNTALLSPEDVQIANQLKGQYADVATALGSVQAQGLRTNAALSGIASTASGTLTTGLADIFDGTKSVSQGFADMSKVIARAIEEMIIKLLIVGPLMRALQGAFGLGDITLGGPNGPTPFPGHAAGTDSSPGGWHMIGEKGPELMNVPKGAQILPNGKLPGGNTTTIQYNIDAAGADSGTIQRIEAVLQAHAATINKQSKAMKSSQNFSQTGVW